MTGFSGIIQTTHDYILQFTIAHTAHSHIFTAVAW
jgi:hypothetical protein